MSPEPAPVVDVEVLEETAELPAVLSPSIPFRTVLSLEPLIEFWQAEAEGDAHGLAETARRILARLEEAPELRGDQGGLENLRRHRPLVEAMFSVILPPGLPRMSCGAVVAPYGTEYFHANPRFRRTFYGPSGQLLARMETHGADVERLVPVFAHMMVLGKVYGIEVPIVVSPHLVVTDPRTGLETYYQMRVHMEHLRVLCQGEPPPLDPALLEQLRDRSTDVDLWRRVLPADRFSIHGFMVHEATEVTAEISLSRLKQLLLEREALADPARYREVERCIRTLLKQPDGLLFVAALHGGRAYFLNPGLADVGQRLEERAPCLSEQDLCDLRERGILGSARSFAVCEACPDRQATGLEKALLARGLARALVAPLEYAGETVGFMAVATNTATSLAAMDTLRAGGVMSLFALAVHNALESMRDRVQAVIMENFTAIHPAVEWRFRQAALRLLKSGHEHSEVEPITFADVYPLYGVSDVRGSSEIRIHSIQADMEQQLDLARDFLQRAHGARPLPYLAYLEASVARSRAAIADGGLRSGDEVGHLEFLRREVEPLFPDFEAEEAVAGAVRAYREALDPELGFVYRQRKDFEESLGRVRELVGSILLEEQERAQAIFPHYFEMHKTDGVDHMIYVGQSLTERPGFREIHLRSLRIWQLQAMARVARETEALKGSLPLPLGTAHLVLVQEFPLAIRFMMDDRRFDVDGAYNARYEIVKKRLDKAEVRGTGERLTQPGHVAVVYSQPREAVEYKEYLRFLADSGELQPGVETLELSDLQGVQGLRALRVRVTP